MLHEQNKKSQINKEAVLDNSEVEIKVNLIWNKVNLSKSTWSKSILMQLLYFILKNVERLTLLLILSKKISVFKF